jgi:hypothetical protein
LSGKDERRKREKRGKGLSEPKEKENVRNVIKR